jgi:hypothetical protein
LGEEVLIFLTSIWISAVSPQRLRLAALRHGVAFINAHGSGVDFQLAVPGLLVTLMDANKEIRQAGLDILKRIDIVAGGASEIYALESFYGSQSSKSTYQG